MAFWVKICSARHRTPHLYISNCLHLGSKGLYDTINALHDTREHRVCQTVQRTDDSYLSGYFNSRYGLKESQSKLMIFPYEKFKWNNLITKSWRADGLPRQNIAHFTWSAALRSDGSLSKSIIVEWEERENSNDLRNKKFVTCVYRRPGCPPSHSTKCIAPHEHRLRRSKESNDLESTITTNSRYDYHAHVKYHMKKTVCTTCILIHCGGTCNNRWKYAVAIVRSKSKVSAV